MDEVIFQHFSFFPLLMLTHSHIIIRGGERVQLLIITHTFRYEKAQKYFVEVLFQPTLNLLTLTNTTYKQSFVRFFSTTRPDIALKKVEKVK